MMGFNFKKWYSENGLKQSTVEVLEKTDLDSEDALKLVQADDVYSNARHKPSDRGNCSCRV